jgi:hypothetical protein
MNCLQDMNSVDATSGVNLKSSAVSPATNSDSRPVSSRSKRDRRRGATSDVVSSSVPVARSGRRSVALTTTENVASITTSTTTSPARDLVARIYEEELRKLVAAAELSGNTSDIAMYNRELARLAFTKTGGGTTVNGVPPSAVSDMTVTEDKENCNSGRSSSVTREDSTSLDGPQDLSMSRVVVGSENSESSARASADSPQNGCQSSDDDKQAVNLVADGLSPLQRMQCIANSLPVAQSTGQAAFSGQSSKPQLPPITSEQLAACDDINTEELVGKVRHL